MLRYALLAGVIALLAGPALAQSTGSKAKSDDKVTDADRAADTVENIATKPLKDMNIVREEIPPQLIAMMDDPYSLKGMRTCKNYSAEIRKIDKMVGPDVDSAEAKADKKDQTPAEFAFGATEAVAGSLIPFSGVIRFVSGAQKRERFAQAAVFAGSVRRSFLKGTARAKGCKI